MNWINISDKLPEKEEDYLCIIKSINGTYYYRDILTFANSLKEVNEYHFGEDKAGFYAYDDEGMDLIDYTDYVMYWMPLPELPNEINITP